MGLFDNLGETLVGKKGNSLSFSDFMGQKSYQDIGEGNYYDPTTMLDLDSSALKSLKKQYGKSNYNKGTAGLFGSGGEVLTGNGSFSNLFKDEGFFGNGGAVQGGFGLLGSINQALGANDERKANKDVRNLNKIKIANAGVTLQENMRRAASQKAFDNGWAGLPTRTL